MKIAKAKYTGRTRGHTRRCPSGETYTFPRGTDDPWVSIEEFEDAEALQRARNLEVEWTARGKLLSIGKDVLEWKYAKKRSIASELDLSFDGQPDEEELDESIEDYLENLEPQGEL